MYKTIKIIDLLNKISNEEAPKKIIYMGNIYDYGSYDYFNTNIGYLFDKYNVTGILNTNIIILDIPEEDKKIEKLSDELTYIKLVDNEIFRKNVVKKINEIIDKIEGE